MSPRKRIKTSLLPLNLPLPPEPSEIRELAEKAIEGLSEIKTIPQEIVSILTEADRDFREADRSLRGVRLRKRK